MVDLTRDDPDLVATVATGDRVKSLKAIRDKIATLLRDADDRTAAALGKELRAVMAEIDSLPGGREVSELDRIADGVAIDLAAERRQRRSPRKPDAASS